MGAAQWLRVVETVSSLAGGLAARSKPVTSTDIEHTPPGGPLEAKLAGVLVAALQEAFDRDRTRMDLEREQAESERRRAEQALAAELRRQAAERAHHELRLISIMAIAAWMLSAALAVWLPGMQAWLPRVLLGAGWACTFATLGAAFSGSRAITTWGADVSASGAAPRDRSAMIAPWLLLGALALTALSLLLAL